MYNKIFFKTRYLKSVRILLIITKIFSTIFKISLKFFLKFLNFFFFENYPQLTFLQNVQIYQSLLKFFSTPSSICSNYQTFKKVSEKQIQNAQVYRLLIT